MAWCGVGLCGVMQAKESRWAIARSCYTIKTARIDLLCCGMLATANATLWMTRIAHLRLWAPLWVRIQTGEATFGQTSRRVPRLSG